VSKEMTWLDHLEIVMSNVREDVCDEILRRYNNDDDLYTYLRDPVFYMHQPECSGGYSDERCPCAWGPKGFHTLFAIIGIHRELAEARARESASTEERRSSKKSRRTALALDSKTPARRTTVKQCRRTKERT
jgi:hypothetical protein